MGQFKNNIICAETEYQIVAIAWYCLCYFVFPVDTWWRPTSRTNLCCTRKVSGEVVSKELHLTSNTPFSLERRPVTCDCNWTPPLSRWRAGGQLQGFPPGQFGGHHWDCTPDRRIQVRVCKVQDTRCVFLHGFTDAPLDMICPSPLLLQVKSLKEDLQKGEVFHIHHSCCLLPIRDSDSSVLHLLWMFLIFVTLLLLLVQRL